MIITATKIEGQENEEDPSSKTTNKMVVYRLHLLEHMCWYPSTWRDYLADFLLKPFKINDLLMTIFLDKTLLMWYNINIMQFKDISTNRKSPKDIGRVG